MIRGVSMAEFVQAGVPRPVARSLRAEAITLDLLVRGRQLSPEAARVQMRRLAARLAGGPR